MLVNAGPALQLRIRYWDSARNSYVSDEVTVDITDLRTKRIPVVLPVVIHWEVRTIAMPEEDECHG